MIEEAASLGGVKFAQFILDAPQGDVDLLTHLSLTTSFTAEQAEKISGHPDAEKRLRILTEKGIVSQVSESPSIYQINGMVSDDFRALLAENQDHFKKTAKETARLLENSNPIKALELFGLSGDSESAQTLAVKNLQHMIYQADMETILKWAPVISKALGGGSRGEKLIKAYGLYANGKYDLLKATLREIETGLPEGQVGEVIKFESNLLRIRLDFTFGHFEKVYLNTKSMPQQADIGLARSHDSHYSLHRNALAAAFYMHDDETFDEFYRIVLPSFAHASSGVEVMNVNAFKSMHAFLQGQYLDANEYALAALHLANELSVEGTYFPYEAAYVLMDTYLEFGEDEKSQDLVDRYLPYAIKCHQYPWIAAFYAKASLIKLQAGNFSSALALIRKGREAIEGPLFGLSLAFILDGIELLVRWPMGDMERISELIYRLPQENKSVKAFTLGLEMMRNPSEAARIVAQFAETTPQEKFRKEIMMANATVNNRPIAIKHLESAVDIAIPNGYFRAFLNMSLELKNLLLDIAAAKPTIYMENLARAIRAQLSAASMNPSDIDTPLTKRELDILRRLATGIPISKIAASLHISNNTIKTHLKNVYRKLSVESREEAVSRGKELSLL